MSLHPRVGGVWLTEIGPFGDVTYSENWLHGCESASWQMNPRTRHPALRPGAPVTIYEQSLPVWSGLLAEPGRDGSMDAAGLWTRGAGVLALDEFGGQTANPNVAAFWAIFRGAVPWARPYTITNTAVGETDPQLTVNALLDRNAETSGVPWRVNHRGNIVESPPPAAPSWALLLAEDLWTTSSDDYVTHLNVYYQSGVGTFASFPWTTAEGIAAADRWGPVEAVLDLTSEDRGLGIISLATAQSYATAKLAQTGPRQVLAEQFQLASGQLRTLGDSAAGWSGVHAGQGLRVWGMPDRSKAVMTLHTDFTIGRVERTATTLTIAPQGLPPRNTRDVIAALSA